MEEKSKFIAFLDNFTRVIYLVLFLIFFGGIMSYVDIPKEDMPDISLPYVNITVTYPGISPEDGVDLLIKPIETQVQSVDGLKTINATAFEGGANIRLEFNAGLDVDRSVNDTKDAVDIAKANLPSDADTPIVKEINISEFPVLSIGLVGDMSLHGTKLIADNLKDKIEALSSVLSADVLGLPAEEAIIQVDWTKMQAYNLKPATVFSAFSINNSLVTAGSMNFDKGAFSIKVPGLVKTPEDILEIPLAVFNGESVTVGDVATVKMGFADPLTITTINGERAVTLQVVKKSGENIIDTIDNVKKIVEAQKQFWPSTLKAIYIGDKSLNTRDQVADLENSIMLTVFLVLIAILGSMGWRSSMLVAMSVPGSFAMGCIALSWFGYTFNSIVMFGLILSVGLLVDGAVIVTEFADRRMNEGHSPKKAFSEAASRMFIPILTSTLTTLLAFLPLVMWPGIAGEFMKFLPITILLVLTSSLIMALVFVPVVGASLGKGDKHASVSESAFTKSYVNLLKVALANPFKIIITAVLVLGFSFGIFSRYSNGIIFFPEQDPALIKIAVHLSGNYSIEEKQKYLARIYQEVKSVEGIKSFYAVADSTGQKASTSDTLGTIQMEFDRWQDRDVTVNEISDEIREKIKEFPGGWIEVKKDRKGPSSGKPISINIMGNNDAELKAYTKNVADLLSDMEGVVDVTTSLPKNGIEWHIDFDKKEAAKYGVSISDSGKLISMLTGGFKVDTFTPVGASEEQDIRLTFDKSDRSLSNIDNMFVSTSVGQVPFSNFIEKRPEQRVTTISRYNTKNVYSVEADVTDPSLTNKVVNKIDSELKKIQTTSVSYTFLGDREQQDETGKFMIMAFGLAVLLMGATLVAQFNSFGDALIVLSSIVLSTAGVFLLHGALHWSFSIAMGGIAIIALAGIIVNNNIVLIDTFNIHHKKMPLMEALVLTCSTRLRPILLTASTCVIGMAPMAFKLNVDIMSRVVAYNTPSTQWWAELSASIGFGLTFATFLTLFVTPCMLLILSRRQEKALIKKQIDNKN